MSQPVPRLVLIVSTVALANFIALQPAFAGSFKLWLSLSVPYAVLAGVGLYSFQRGGTLGHRLRPRSGDLSLGAVVAGLLLVGSWVGRSVLTPAGSPEQAWLFNLYLQIGDPEIIQRSFALTLLTLALAAFEEIVWRGLVLDLLTEGYGARAAWLLSAVLYALALTPSLYTLRAPQAGLNPLLVFAGFGCGLVWAFMTRVTGRLPPAIIAHMAFTYFSVVQFRLPGL